MVCPPPKTADLEELFRQEVFKMLNAEGKINDTVIENMLNWPPARRAFQDVVSTRRSPTPRRENLARYTCPPLEDYTRRKRPRSVKRLRDVCVARPVLFLARADDLHSGP